MERTFGLRWVEVINHVQSSVACPMQSTARLLFNYVACTCGNMFAAAGGGVPCAERCTPALLAAQHARVDTPFSALDVGVPWQSIARPVTGCTV